ncbi:flagellar protein FliT [Bacillus mesophilus]|uniref:Flagellar protein FliT n=1 Tax=Bacillus mesophilus TaxID=1808955 RepID=A0A6M0Q9Q9_9BACI|nr:flagellar protein FliT [Bacillus mesophilus]MBM7661581.1 flagellar protein FliT [Bacillus mesophilus]NEY72250.1 flagellar protein FliT [Bacillus mesophilus]
MSQVQEIYDLTTRLYELLKVEGTNEERDVVIPEVDLLLIKRQELLDQLKDPFSDEEKLMGQEIIEMNRVIDEKMVHLKSTIQADINKLKKQKSSNEKYTNPYKNVSLDGTFFDKKK